SAHLKPHSLIANLYQNELISERHRHRFEVNPYYHKILNQNGLIFSGTSKDGLLVEFIELDQKYHPFFAATQAHPEFKSRPDSAHPLFKGLVAAALR
ncbi:CTP synthase, partial [Candidatus Berkelbacteria bacterium]|nr:CTP synthase [Candidatus Berkelbacteria bacterium]